MDWSLRWIIPESDLDEMDRSSLVRSSFDEFAKQRENITMMRMHSDIGERLKCEAMIREGICVVRMRREEKKRFNGRIKGDRRISCKRIRRS